MHFTSTRSNRPATVLYVDHTSRLGGGEIALLNMVRAMDHGRFRPVVALAHEGPLAIKLRAAGIETHVLSMDGAVLDTRKDGLGASALLKFDLIRECLRYSVRLGKFARQVDACLVHTNSLKSDIYGGLAGRIAGIPVIWHVRDNISSPYLPASAASAFRGLSRVIPNLLIANSQSTLRTLRRPASQSVYNAGGGGQGVRGLAEVVHDGADIEAYPESNGASTNRVVAMVGRIAGWKGQDVFIRAAASVRRRFPDVRYQIIGAPLFGEDKFAAKLHALVAELGMEDRIEFLGFRDDVPSLLAQVDVLVHASVIGEPFGQVVIEGMAAAKPIVATNGGALPEIVVAGETGYLVPMGDSTAMAAAIADLLSDPAKAASMGAAGRQRVLNKFTIGHTARKVEHIYDSLLAHDRSGDGHAVVAEAPASVGIP